MPSPNSPGDDFFNDLSQQPSNDSGNSLRPNNERSNSIEGGQDNDANPKAKRIACVLCRKRKLRCDGSRPSCGTCKRLSHDCAYDEVRKKSGPKRGYVKQLEARLHQVEDLLKNQHAPDPVEKDPARDYTRGLNFQSTTTAAPDSSMSYPTLEPPLGTQGGVTPRDSFSIPGSDVVDAGPSAEQQHFEIIGLGLEEPLPPQDTINDLHRIFFEKIHPSAPMIHRPRYLAAMSLSPLMRPPVSLRYMVWCLAASVSDKYAALEEHFYQRARKYMEIDEMRGHGENIITVAHCQAWVLISLYEFKLMYFPRAWMSTGRAVRLAQMMGLHRLDGPGLDVKQCLPPPRDWTEREERRRTFWMCFCEDRYASIGTGWPMTLEEKDIKSNLPSSDENFDKSKPVPTASLEDTLKTGGATSMSAFGGVVLMACLFGRNLTHLHRPTPDDHDNDLNGEFWKRHRALEGILSDTALALSDSLRLPTALPDPNAIMLNMNLHTSIICLHQAAIFKADKHRLPAHIGSESRVRCVTAAAEIARIMRMLTHLDLSAMNPFISFCLYVAARVFVQYLKFRPKDQQMTSSLQFLLNSMQALKRKNPLTESFIVQLDLDLEGAGIDVGQRGVNFYKRNFQVSSILQIFGYCAWMD
ncbi:hypothetical protein K402DRAFT_326987 [Aulographum hederae CBS 113979]|uniref:Zn(2)-C6 fungal-type domain-containing protein n=1 Tax=Aulographum hederae CBS 113979 TaxID=1176131 RepID=A0A6G1H829_9PEZI|nr:hypothetical protein K402DRAFT_326987 [Aulographum hederae CBS 113979]